MKKLFAVVGLLGSFMAVSALADAKPVYLKYGGEYTDGIDLSSAQGSAAKYAANYTDGQNVHSGANYIYSKKYIDTDGQTKTMADNQALIRVGICNGLTFAGDSLQIGSIEVPTAAFEMKQRRMGDTITSYGNYAKLILCDGIWYVGGNDQNLYHGFAGGEIEVRSPIAKPFHFYNTISGSSFTRRGDLMKGTWSYVSTLKGTSDVALKFSLNDVKSAFPWDFRLLADNSAYKGKFVVRNAGARLLVASTTALGTSDVLTSDAITLEDGGALSPVDGTSVTLASATRGVTVAATGGRFDAAKGSMLTLHLPISGEGDVRICGGGLVILDGDYRAGTITVAADTLFLVGTNADLHGAQIVYESGACKPLPFDGVTNELDLAANNGNKFAFVHGSLTTSGCYTATSVCQTWPVAFKIFDGFIRPEPTVKFPVLRIPTALKTVTADDFFVSGETPYDHKLTVETDGDMQTVYLRFPKVLKAVDVNNYKSTWKDGTTEINVYEKWQAGGTTWSDFETAYADYAWNLTLADCRRINSPYHSNPYVGSPLSMKGTGSGATTLLNACIKTGTTFTWADARLYGYLYLYGNSCNPTIAGKLSILGSEAVPNQIYSPNEKGTIMQISADIHGDGFVCLRPHLPQYGGRTLDFAGDNRRFLGTFDAMSTVSGISEAGAATNNFIWAVKDGNSFGGNNAVFTADAVRLRGGTVLKVASDITMPHVNRGFTVSEWPKIDVAQNKVFRLSSRMTIAGQLTKTGEGLLVLEDVVAKPGARLVVAGGQVSFGCAIPANLEVTYTRGAYALPANGATEPYPSFLPPGMTLGFSRLSDGTTSGCYEMSASAKAAFWPIGIQVLVQSRPAPSERFAVLRIPTSVRVVTEDDFFAASLSPASETYAIETVDGMQTLYVSFPEVLKAVRLQNSDPMTVWKGSDGVCYTNTEDATHAYRVDETVQDSGSLRVCKLTQPFAGQSFSVARSDGSYQNFPLRNGGFSFPEARFYAGAALCCCNGGSIAKNEIGGTFTVVGTEEKPTWFTAADDKNSYNSSLRYNGKLRGEGFLRCAASGSDACPPRINLNGDNAHFIGKMDVSVTSGMRSRPMFDPDDHSRTNNLTLEASTPTAFGGALPAFDAKALRFGWSSVVKVQCDITLPENRGLYIYESPLVEVASGKTFEVPERMTMNGTLAKTGTGTLRIAGAVAETASAGANVMKIEAGAFEVTEPSISSNVVFDVAAAASTTLRLSRAAIGTPGLVNMVDEAPFGASGAITLAWADGEGLSLEPRAMRRASVPLMTVKAAAAAAIADRIVLPTGEGAYQLRTETEGDFATIYVDAKLSPGILLLVR